MSSHASLPKGHAALREFADELECIFLEAKLVRSFLGWDLV
jgi:hypothetical protein